jgi:hypothetical protein
MPIAQRRAKSSFFAFFSAITNRSGFETEYESGRALITMMKLGALCISVLLSFAGTSSLLASTCGLFDAAGLPVPCTANGLKQSNWSKVEKSALLTGRPPVGTLTQFGKNGKQFGRCTASFVTANSAADAPVYILTAGHCASENHLTPGEFLADAPTGALSYFSVGTMAFPLGKVAYAIFDGWDLALYETRYTRAQIESFQISPFQLDSGSVDSQTSIQFSGYSALTQDDLYMSTCKVDAFAYGSEYQFRCSAAQGMSGAAVLASQTKRVVGVVNTMYGDFNSASSTHLLPDCFEPKGVFNLKLSSCKLPRPSSDNELCDSGQPAACLRIGELYREGQSGPDDLATAAEFYEKGCRFQDAKNCRHLAELHVEMSKIELGFTFFEKACSLGDQAACANLGRYHELGVAPAKRDPNRARELYQAACGRKVEAGCFYLGLLYEKGLAVEQSSEKAAVFFETACDFGLDLACAKLKTH